MTRIEQIRRKHWHELGEQDVRDLLSAWDTRDTALRALVQQWRERAAWHAANGETPQQGELESCIAAVARLMGA